MLERSRFMVGDAVWEKIAPLLPGKASDPGATARDNRLFLEAVLWRGRGGAPPRGPPGGFWRWGKGFPRVPPWGEGGLFLRIFWGPARGPGLRYTPLDRPNFYPP